MHYTTSQVGVATLQVLYSPIWLTATVSDGAGLGTRVLLIKLHLLLCYSENRNEIHEYKLVRKAPMYVSGYTFCADTSVTTCGVLNQVLRAVWT